jgi:eukaryotic-like serine/threonine-protein kinase
MDRSPPPRSTQTPAPADAPTHTLAQAVGGSSTEVTKVGPEQVPPHLSAIQFWQIGRQVGDFVLQAKLGEGGLGTVYLARQLSLDRLVALKITDATTAGTGEGLTLAGLEHEHIVKVYSGFIEPVTNKHCLCLQYVPGTSLAALIARLHGTGPPPRTGQDLLDALDELAKAEIAFDPKALADREKLAEDDFPAAVCRLGEQLADALAFAHGRGFLHCDVKPGNILLTPYGRPMLVDFNIAVNSGLGSACAVGGTPKYMAPEQHDAFCGRPHDPINHAIDLFSLGVVLFELTTGSRPSAENGHLFDRMPRELAIVIRRCLQPKPTDRYPDAAALAAALAGARHLIAARGQLPRPGWLGRHARRRPLTVLLALALVPHIVATGLNIAYNAVQIALTDAQFRTFTRITASYNTLIWIVCVAWGVRLLRRFHRERLELLAGRRIGEAAGQVRRDTLRFGYRGNFFAFVGWVPGAILFPTLLHVLDGPLPAHDFAHFLISFALSGLVGMVYSYYGIQFVILRAVYPHVGDPDTFDADRARDELARGTRWLEPFLVLATLIPLTGAILLIAFADGIMSREFRWLVAGLIVLGMGGVTGLVRARDRLAALMEPWRHGTDDRRHPAASSSSIAIVRR